MIHQERKKHSIKTVVREFTTAIVTDIYLQIFKNTTPKKGGNNVK